MTIAVDMGRKATKTYNHFSFMSSGNFMLNWVEHNELSLIFGTRRKF